ncbi:MULTISPECIES: recombinase family protein [unclassified Pseudomonas]|uniref:recombinase family protein n=1 Tax=unclassified Pseudomonas TaxID=196821 RepID=UPI0018E70890|nr:MULTISPECIES: recombinase family protein [Pseudomonas]MBJ2304209.1 recombinase family protein [Pseudomonas sp. MF2846]MBK3488940.1 recombinase family protein [Pseudomonas sp. MF2857]MDW8840685.1 recombinase family protein [Pseudomonas carnis]
MKIGYARVSTRDQKADLQVDALKKAGCERIYQDIASGAKSARPELDKLLANVRAGDAVVIWKLDRLGRSLKHLVELVGELAARKVGLQSLNDPIDTTHAQGRLVFNLFASLAEFERELIRERTQAGLSAARARGRVGGRPKGLPAKAEATAMAAETLYREGRLSVSAIGERLHISKSTLYSYLRHRGVDIGTYQKSTQTRGQRNVVSPAESAAERVATITLRLAVENNSKFVRGRKRAKENIERYCLEPFGVKRLESGNYELSVPYQSEDELDKAVHDLLSEISQEAEMRNCFIEADAWEDGTERRW